MKRTKLLALTLVVAIMMLGAGYALWDDVLTLNETIVMGDVDVEWYWNGIKADSNTGGFVAVNPVTAGNTNRSPDKNTYTVRVENAYPGAEVRWDGSMINKGSLPVKFDNVDLVVKQGTGFVPYLDVHYDTRHLDNDTGWSGYNHQNFTFNDFETTMNSDATLKGYILEKEERIQFGAEEDEENCIIIKFSEDLPEGFMNQTLEFDLIFTYVQAFN